MKFGEKLLQAKLIDQAQLEAALSHQQETGQLLGEALLELGYLSEENLLKFLAKEFNTRFVASAKLQRIGIGAELLEMVPQAVAEKNHLLPVLYDRQKNTLGVVTPEPQQTRVIEELQIVAGVDRVQAFVASREAIRAAIKKHYKGDIQAFAALDQASTQQPEQPMELYSDRVLDHDQVREEPQAAPKSSGPAVVRDEAPEERFSEATSSWTRQIEAVRGGSLVSDNDFIETLNILVGLLEMQRSGMQGHSAKIARLTKAISERMGLKERDINHNIIAAYLHDLGKRASVHLTLLSIAHSEDHRRRARRYHLTPARLFDSVHLPPQVNHIIGHLYEFYDGSGLPEQLSGEGIPTGAKIIAVVDAYEDLIANSTNPLGKILEPEAAFAEIRAQAERLFDPQIVRMLGEVISADEARAQLSAANPLVLVADADNASTSVIELKLVKKGFRVRVARDSQTAQESLRSEPVAALLVEMRIEPDDGFAMLEFLRREGLQVPVFMVSSDPSPEAVTRAFDAGVVDFITKPFVPEVVIAKIYKELATGERAPAPATPAEAPAPSAGASEIEISVDAAADAQEPALAEEEAGEEGVVIELDDAGGLESAMAAAEQSVGEDGIDLSDEGGTIELADDGEMPGLGDQTGQSEQAAVPDLPDEAITGPPAAPKPEEEGRPEEQTLPGPPTGTMAGVVATGSRILSGTLEGKAAITLIRAIAGKRKSGMLSLRVGEMKGTIYFEQGHVFQAIVGEAQAEEAFLELASWRDCLYKFDPSQTAKSRVIKTSTGKLIQIAGMQS